MYFRIFNLCYNKQRTALPNNFANFFPKENKIMGDSRVEIKWMIDLWSLMPLSTIFLLYRGDQFYWWRKPEYPEKTTDLSQG
jgi:hypothetical protein